MSTLAEVTALVAEHGLVVRRAWPRSAEHLLLDLVPATGPAVAGQWLAEPSAAGRVAAKTGRPATVHGRVVLQPSGADRRLRAVARLLQQPGAVLVAHRPERRAVVRRPDGAYAKVVGPDRIPGLLRAASITAGCGARVPTVVDVDRDSGVVTTAALSGRTLFELLVEGGAPAVAAARQLGGALAALHASPLPAGAAVHDAEAERKVLARWLQLARVHGVLRRPIELPDVPPGAAPLVPVHRDLHDKQVLVDASGDVGLIDFDLAAAGEAALDLANLLVHLELRVHQGRCSPELGAAAARAVLAGYAPRPDVLRRLPFYDAATRRRLVAVYAFRPPSAAAARRLLDTPLLRSERYARGDTAGQQSRGALR